jgi:XTP/dITP diphosphohydrolase
VKTIYFITSNKGKVREVKNRLQIIDIQIIQKNLGYPEIQSNNLEDVTKFGLEYIKNKINYPFMIEDAGLFIDTLKEFPGVYSAYIFNCIGCDGILKLLNDAKDKNRKAYFKSVIGYYGIDKKPYFFKGVCNGKISSTKSGNKGFGYDPIFIPDGEERTFAQMDATEKNYYSHRGSALNKLSDFLKEK